MILKFKVKIIGTFSEFIPFKNFISLSNEYGVYNFQAYDIFKQEDFSKAYCDDHGEVNSRFITQCLIDPFKVYGVPTTTLKIGNVQDIYCGSILFNYSLPKLIIGYHNYGWNFHAL